MTTPQTDEPVSRLRALRERRNLSRYRVAEDTGIPYATMTRLENPDLERMSRKHIRLLVKYFGPELILDDFLS